MNRHSLIYPVSLVLLVFGCSPPATQDDTGRESASTPEQFAESFEDQVSQYIQKFPYQETYNYALGYTGGDPDRLNSWLLPPEPALVKAGEDPVVRTNNDTYYNMAFVVLDDRPLFLESKTPSGDRFYSFQLMDDRNANYRNVIHPDGEYTLYFGQKPSVIRGEPIEVPSRLSVVLLRVEVRDKNAADDVAAAKSVYRGMTLTGAKPTTYPQNPDLLTGFDANVTLTAAITGIPWLPEVAYVQEQWDILDALVKLLPLAVVELKNVFRQEGQVDFIEIAGAAREALGSELAPGDLLLQFDSRIRHILVDEFQDTSYAQYELLRILTSGWTPGDGRTPFGSSETPMGWPR